MLSMSLQAQDHNTKKAIGLHFGSSTGNGYAMRWMGKDAGFQLTFGAYTFGDNKVYFSESIYDYDNDATLITAEEEGRESAVNVGLNYMFMLDHFRNGRLYMMVGGSYKYFAQKIFSQDYQLNPGTDYYYPVDGSQEENLNIEHRWTVGAGPGFDLALGKQFRLAVELPITYNWNNDVVMYVPQVGLYYYFK